MKVVSSSDMLMTTRLHGVIAQKITIWMVILGYIASLLGVILSYFQPLLRNRNDIGLNICGCCSQETAINASLDVSFDNMQEWEINTGESREIYSTNAYVTHDEISCWIPNGCYTSKIMYIGRYL
jgi:hypothetical protein